MLDQSKVHVPPHDIDAERSVLGSILIDKDAIVKVVEFLRPEHFYKDSHKLIFEAVLSLYEQREPADLITVPNELRRTGNLERCGGVANLTELVNSIPTTANVESYARIIHEGATRRNLIRVAADINELVFSEAPLSEVMDRSEQILYSVAQDRVYQEFVPVRQTLEVTFERLEELSRNRGEMRGIPTGLKNLDRLLNGLQKENLIILAGRPSVGKSALAINMVQYAATNKDAGVAIFSLEMSKESIVDRMISSQAGIDNWKIATGNLSEEDFEKYGIASGELAEAAIYIDDTPGLSVLEMRTKARRLMSERKIDLIVIDYLQLIQPPKAESRVQEVSAISLALKNLARELKVPVVALSQLSRAVEQRGGANKPQLSDLRDSGSIEQDADVVMFVYRPDDEDRTSARLFLAKHRNGPTGEIDLFFKQEYTRFYEVERQRED
ncbi:replicative DNA helicase [candidate division WWE3 bacterium RIFOXYC1_FULL_40_10]|uniref:Replicative DNA helicase n=1 Tax=candidate division WWE3 bacterium RIFOXYA2_FULL_46_9 TaxID=1802636 RepID=A0A1F4W1S7_UNCKA|nr:MAG: replicative DNA helicase [candidate division WWE3 bacterium RIFOXYB1_FULL_40_22]OGC61444.1 MAG: replicative DNA helicase [candidate division WWE3 bacterium RIFOXYA1_FULL_40_11]OGC63377.1 MAG: replicative DNA helicase [candidate division WWE3 bacterium RIFOXYA2_FULL_46_9]OGC64445.1 MAG: replicative DNA helicase [candidate division WWE3 bacterium RIFOXYB2_FULL_41_6]OGC65827.1 MAG: replicative DNA helicase [candidate division WWE3 bacterium RIFOXYC1_FULL_40_10]OGC67364.1 MAG: replicative 